MVQYNFRFFDTMQYYLTPILIMFLFKSAFYVHFNVHWMFSASSVHLYAVKDSYISSVILAFL